MKNSQFKIVITIISVLLLLLIVDISIKNINNRNTTNTDSISKSDSAYTYQYRMNKDSIDKSEIIKFKSFLTKLPNYSPFVNNDVQMSFTPFNFGNEFIFDRYSLGYSSEWHYKRADRGNKYLLSIATITSKNKNPLLPDICAYYIDSTNIHFISKFEYRLYSWSDYGAYLGNYTDYKNDFAYTETINFDIGALIDEKYMALPIIIVASKSGNAIRSNNIYGNPPISYQSDNSITSFTINYNNYTIITILNKHKL